MLMRQRARAPRGDPFVMRRERRLDLGLGRGVPLHRPQPPQLRERDDRGGLAAEVDYLIRHGADAVTTELAEISTAHGGPCTYTPSACSIRS